GLVVFVILVTLVPERDAVARDAVTAWPVPAAGARRSVRADRRGRGARGSPVRPNPRCRAFSTPARARGGCGSRADNEPRRPPAAPPGCRAATAGRRWWKGRGSPLP